MAKVLWFERAFRFDAPVDLHPMLVERLRGLLPRVRAHVSAVGPEGLTQGLDGTWSIQENIGHLVDLEPLWDGRLTELLEGAEVLRAADLENTKTHDANHGERRIGEILAELEEVRSSFVARLDDLSTEDFARTSRHPRLDQPMRLIDLCFFVAEHDDHHLARITEIARTLRARS